MRKIIYSVICVCLFVLIGSVFTAAAERVVITDPERAMLVLAAGNDRFMAGKVEKHDIDDAKREDLFKNGQTPFASVISCSDSRLPPELIFDQGLGDIFVVRTAGNVLDSVGMGSIEFSAAVLNTPLIAVIGHEACGAVYATVDGAKVSDNITAISDLIEPAVKEAREAGVAEVASTDIYEAAVDANVRRIVAQLKENDILKILIAEKKLKVIGGKYHMGSGKVEFFE